MSTVAPLQENLPSPAEANTLAREMAGAFGRMIAFYKKHYQLSAQEALARAEEPASEQYVELILTETPDQVSWLALENLAPEAYPLYEQFQSLIPEGGRGWGAKGNLDLARIARLAKKEQERSAPDGPQRGSKDARPE